MKLINKSLLINILIVFAGALLFIPFLGGVHLFDWDEINFAEAAREMLVTKDYLTVHINYQPFMEKPPLFFWMQVVSMKMFGVTEFAARFPNAICGIISLLVLFNIGKKIYDIKFGLLWVLVYTGSLLPFFYFKSGIIDPCFNLFIFLGIWFIHKTYFKLHYNNQIDGNLETKIDTSKNNYWSSAIAGGFTGLAVLTKGPVGLLIVAMCIFIFKIYYIVVLKSGKTGIKDLFLIPEIINLLIFVLVLCLVGGFWFLTQALSGNSDFIMDFIIYQIRLFSTKDAGHGGFFLYHFVILLFGVFPASVFALRGFVKNESDTLAQNNIKAWMMILFWLVLILFTIVKTKIVHYSSLCYFPLTFLAAYTIHKILNSEIIWKKIFNVILIIVGIVPAIFVIALPIVGLNSKELINTDLIKDEFAMANLGASVEWSYAYSLIGIFMIVGIVVSILLFKSKYKKRGFISIFVVSIVFIYLTMIFIVPKIEQYSQNAAIEFYKDKQDEDCYIETLGFRSYAHLFYSKIRPYNNEQLYSTDWLLTGSIDKTAYFVCRINRKQRYIEEHPQLKLLYEKNGFVFFKRI